MFILFWYHMSKWQILTIGIKVFIWIFSIGIKILFVFSKLVSMPLFNFQLVSILKCFYISFQLVSNALHWHILIGIIFDCTPYCHFFLKKGENIVLFYSTPLLMIDKKGENYCEFICMFHVFICMFMSLFRNIVCFIVCYIY